MQAGNRKSPYLVSEKSYLLSDISRSNCPLPLPCVVQDGFYGESSWDTVSSGETILLSKLEKRLRVLAHDDTDKYYSIPLNYPLKFSVVSAKGKEISPKSIGEILKTQTLPVTLKLDQRNTTLHSVKDLKRAVHLGNIVLTRTYDEKYFVGNCIISNKLQSEPIMLPTFLKVRIGIMEGITGVPTLEWVSLLETWKATVKQYSANTILPPIDIVIFQNLPPEAETIPSTALTPSKQADIYESLEPTTYVKLNFNYAQRKSNEYTFLADSPKPEGFYSSIIDSNQSKPPEDPPPTAAITENLGLREELQKTLSIRRNSLTTYNKPAVKESPRPSVPAPANSQTGRPEPPPKLYKSLSVGITKKTPGMLPLVETVHALPPPPSPDQSPSPARVASNRSPPPPPPPSPPPPTETLTPDLMDEIDPDYAIEPRQHSSMRNLKDIPPTVEALNIEEVADCLRLLKMARYIESFLANQIDGSLLSQLDETILIGDLQMTPLHAKKLIMFAQKGWRPVS